MSENKKFELIHFHVYDPVRSIFKSDANEKSSAHFVKCNNKDDCELYGKKQCVCRRIWGPRCPYGYDSKEIGFTKKARNYSSWINEQKENNKDVGSLDSPAIKMARVGEFIYLPYSHMNMNGSVWGKDADGGYFAEGEYFLKLERFNPLTILSIIRFKPQALFGGEITSYQKEVVPVFIKHLSEVFPDLWKAVLEMDNSLSDRLKEYTSIGRKALLRSVKPNVGTFKTAYGEWIWDGEKLRLNGGNTIGTPIYNNTAIKETIVIPSEDAIVKITSDEQVKDNTEFID